ncbi:MAG: TRAP transporter small permease [Gammaproteobacteria bacterium]|nr:TRAP transporter small permease [Gammaproteobacteria bacterium]
MRCLLDGLYRVSGALAALFILSICLVVIIQVTFNLVDRLAGMVSGQAIGLTIPSYADFTGFFLAAATFLGLAYTLRSGGHIRVTIITGVLSCRVRRLFELWSIGLAMALTAYATWYALALTRESYRYNDLSSGMIAVPLWIPQLAVAFGLAVLTIALLDEFVSVTRGRAPSYEGQQENLLGSPGDK